MMWTKTTPTTTGYYWLRMNGHRPEVVRIDGRDATGRTLTHSTHQPNIQDAVELQTLNQGVEWAGPIPEPAA